MTTPTPKALHRALMWALEREDDLKAREAPEAELTAARAAVVAAMLAYDKAGFDPMEARIPHDKRYAVRMHGGLLARSEAQDWHEAVQEWTYGRQCGYSQHELVCDLCLCSKVKYWFVITNRVNGKQMQIGSECIQNWHSPGIVTAIEFDRKGLEKAQKKALRADELERAAKLDPWLQERLPKLRRTVEKYGKVFDEAEDRVRAALGKKPLKGRPTPPPAEGRP